jgi:hypothetical protein
MRVWLIIALYFLPILLFGQQQDRGSSRFDIYLDQYLVTKFSQNLSKEELNAFMDKLEDKKDSKKNESDFLELIFSKVHSKFLKQYQDYSTFGELLDKGKYNCLTGTALYALVLDYFDFQYEVIETNYHIFLLVESSEPVLFEATDPQYGFVRGKKMVDQRINEYKKNQSLIGSTAEAAYNFDFDLFNEVDLNELTGLLYYNQSIDAFNKHQIDQSVNLLDKASLFYKSERIKEFSQLILLALLQSNLENSTKQDYVNKVRSLVMF